AVGTRRRIVSRIITGSKYQASTPSLKNARMAAIVRILVPPVALIRTGSFSRSRSTTFSIARRQFPKSNGLTRTLWRLGSNERRRRNAGDRKESRPPTRRSRSYGSWRRLGRTCLSSNPIVAMSAPASMESPEEQLDAGRGDDQEPAAVGRIGLALDRAHRLEFAQMVVHRGLVDPKGAGQGRFRERLLAVLDEKREHFPLLSGQSFAVRHPEERERELAIRLVVHVRRRDPLQDANQERRTAHEPGASRDVESEVHPRGLLLADIRSNLPCDLQEIIGVADLDRGTRNPQPSAKFHDLGPSVPALRMIAVVKRDAVEMARRPDRREQALWPPTEGAEKHGHAPCSPSSNNKKFLPSNPRTIRRCPGSTHSRNHFIVLLR